jgi:hypothetical protein
MNVEEWLSDIGHAGRLFFESIPQALWLAYAWAKEWQSLLAGVLLLVAARIFAQGSMRAARIRATGMIRSAQIAAGTAPGIDARPSSLAVSQMTSRAPISAETELLKRLEQLRSLIRSAMSTLTTDTGDGDSSANFFCERIAALRLGEGYLPTSLTPEMRDLHKKLLTQLEALRRATENKASQSELSHALVQLNTRAREFSAVLAPTAQQASAAPARTTSRV